ncbi:MAG: 1-deoxy-D-xylulose-5-phosphate synthase [Negativicutes bacterium]|nr:1-deoxy-D-xylulose-5-phosphate synthase [Negativicutes bacterium]
MKYKLLPTISPRKMKMLSTSDLNLLAKEIRNYLLETVSKTGGHLASNLGVVELTIALHKAFQSPTDKIIWDVGHQSYVHKLLTGRYADFPTLRQFGGLSGYPKRSESVHDIFNAGHSSTSISAALGIALARDVQKKDFQVVAVIGDGSMTGGMAWEAMNHAGRNHTKLIVILNDNEMSIAQNVGALSEYLNNIRTAPRYYRTKDDAKRILERIPAIGQPAIELIDRVKESVKQFFVPGMLFEEMGFTYLGPINGHHIGQLLEAMELAKRSESPVLLHVITTKGKGYPPAEKSPRRFHGTGPFDLVSGRNTVPAKPGFTDAFALSLLEVAEEDASVVAITAAMPDGTGLSSFAERYPTRFFDVAIAEQHAVTFAAGLAVQGLKPIVAIYSTFLQRAFDQIIEDVAMQNLPVVLVLDRAGLVGEDGETHHGVFDLSYLRLIPNMTLLVALKPSDLTAMLRYALQLHAPVALRFPKGAFDKEAAAEAEHPLLPAEVALPQVFIAAEKKLVIACGPITFTAEAALRNLKQEDGQRIGLINLRMIKPLPTEPLLTLLFAATEIAVVEDNTTCGGFGSAILEFCQANHIYPKCRLFGIPDRFIQQGSTEQLYQSLQLDADSLAQCFKVFFQTEQE